MTKRLSMLLLILLCTQALADPGGPSFPNHPDSPVLLTSTMVTGALLMATFYPTYVTGENTQALTQTSGDATRDARQKKIMRMAREDALIFIATDGQQRTAKLEAAFRIAKEMLPGRPDDMELASYVIHFNDEAQ